MKLLFLNTLTCFDINEHSFVKIHIGNYIVCMNVKKTHYFTWNLYFNIFCRFFAEVLKRFFYQTILNCLPNENITVLHGISNTHKTIVIWKVFVTAYCKTLYVIFHVRADSHWALNTSSTSSTFLGADR